MMTLTLPRLVGTRESADDLLAEAQVKQSLAGEHVVLQCHDLVSGSPSFADQLVKRLLIERDAAALNLVGSPDRFATQVHEAASRRMVSDRVHRVDAATMDV